MSVDSAINQMEALQSYFEQLATRRAKLEDEIRRRRQDQSSKPMTMTVKKYKYATNEKGEPVRTLTQPEHGVDSIDDLWETFIQRSEFGGYYGQRHPLSKGDVDRMQKVIRIYKVLSSYVPPEDMPVFSSLVGNMLGVATLMSGKQETSSNMELLRAPISTLPSEPTPEEQPRRQLNLNRRAE